MRGVLILSTLLVGACFTKPDRPSAVVDAAPTDVAGDASTSCLLDSFDSGTSECLPWGTSYGNAGTSVASGNLVITPLTTGQNDGGCITNDEVPFTEGGLFIEVLQVVSVPSGNTALTIDDASRYPRIGYRNGMLQLSTLAGVTATRTYSASDMRWWRLRPNSARDKIIAEYSADAVLWEKLGELSDPPTMFRASFEGGVTEIEANPGTALIGEFHLCP